MMKRAFVLALVASAGTLAGCSSDNVRSMSDPAADFSKLATFSWAPIPGLPASEPTLRLLDQNLRSSISAELTARGFHQVEQGGQMLIAYQTMSADRIRVTQSHPTGVNTWGRPWGTTVVATPNVRQYTEGTLVVSAIDPARNIEIWQGTGSRRVTSSSLEPEAIRSKVAAVMRDFPRRN